MASNITLDPSVAAALAITPDAIIEKDLTPGILSVHPTAGYLTGSTTLDGAGATATIQGFGGTGEAEYSFSEHVGLNFSALGYSGSGGYTPGAAEIGASTGSCSINGWLLGVTLVLDPFSGPGFRMPFFIGVNYEHLASSTPSSPIITSMTLNSPGYTIGFSPRFNIGFLRLEPFLVTTTPFEKGNVQCAAGVVGLCGPIAIQPVPIEGINIVFRPWNLSFYFNVSSLLVGTGVSFFSLGPQLSF
jgi:hypothetical protein